MRPPLRWRGCPWRSCGRGLACVPADAHALMQERLAPLDQPSNRRCTRITVLADHGLPVGVATLRSFSALAIALAD
jgi:hypothetical protein